MKPQLAHGFLQPHGLGRTSAPHRKQVGRGRALGEAGRAGEEGIGAAFVSDSGFGSMSGVHDGRFGQGEQLTLDTGDEGVEVAARQVGAPDRPREQHIAAKHDAGTDEADTSGGVPRRVPHLEGDLAPFAPLLRTAEIVHVGKGSTFGLGKVEIKHAS